MTRRPNPLHDTDLLALTAAGWSDRRSRARGIVETVLWMVAVACLLVVAWNLIDASIYQRQAAMALEQSHVLPPGEDADDADTLGTVASGAPVGRLEIPRLDLSVIVAEGVDESVLRRAVGRIPSSAIPDDGGNLALAGHRDSFFRPLEDIQVGDLMTFEPAGGEAATYRVRWTRVVDPDSAWVAAPTLEPVLTLVTCYPFRYVGPAPQRFVVRAERILEGHAPADPTDIASSPPEQAVAAP